MPVDSGCSASACAVQLSGGGLVVLPDSIPPSRAPKQHQQHSVSPYVGTVMSLWCFLNRFFFSSCFSEGVALLMPRKKVWGCFVQLHS